MKDFQVGEKVIHSNYGLGEVIQIDEKVLSDEPTRCYVVKVRDLKIWVPAGEKSTGSLRRPTPPSKFDRLFAILRSPGEPLSDNRFERKTQLSESLRNGKPEGICQVIRDLSYFGQSKKLNESDKTLLQRMGVFISRLFGSGAARAGFTFRHSSSGQHRSPAQLIIQQLQTR
jgi:RNA polymerase-interacting CarD/CdnL/TRCF family regulator